MDAIEKTQISSLEYLLLLKRAQCGVMNAFRLAQRPLRIAFFGDSETSGSGLNGAYRVGVFDRAYGDGVAFKMVGKNFAGTSPRVIEEACEGFPGMTIAGLQTQIVTDLPDLGIDIGAVMIGTNNMTAADVPAVTLAAYNSMILAITAAAPNVWWYFMSIPPADPAKVSSAVIDNTKVASLNASLPGLIATLFATGLRVVFVDACGGVNLSEMANDGQHMGLGAYAKVASKLYKSMFYGPPSTGQNPNIAYVPIASNFNPNSIAGNTSQIYAENAVVVANRVQTIPDVSGNGATATAVGAPKPLFSTPGANWLGQGLGAGFGASLPGNLTFPMITTDGAQNYFDFAKPLLGTTAFTAIYVLAKTYDLTTNVILAGQVGGGHTTQLTMPNTALDAGVILDGVTTSIASKGPVFVFAVVSLKWDGATLKIRKDGTALRSVAMAGTGGNGNTSLGVAHMGPDVFGQWQITAQITYNIAISDTNELLCERFLGQRYGLAVT